MKVILLKDVPSLGHKYEIRDVSAGYATNFLIPRGVAVLGTSSTIKRFEEKAKEATGRRQVEDALLAKTIEGLDGTTLTLVENANEQGHLFAGVHTKELVVALASIIHTTLPEHALILSDPIKTIGTHKVNIRGGGKGATINVVVEKKE